MSLALIAWSIVGLGVYVFKTVQQSLWRLGLVTLVFGLLICLVAWPTLLFVDRRR